ncbi:MAG: response regulator transcription factor [Halioglobus sp.]|nr:response regulator transcription factor [Halioglobus sp.]
MLRVFVTTIGYMRERWELAFPGASAVSSIAEVDGLSSSVTASVWLDISVIAQESRQQAIVAASGLGWPVVVMTGVPEDAEAFAALNAGARGYCHVKAAPEQLREIALVVENRGLWMPTQLMQRFLSVTTRIVPPIAPDTLDLNTLTSRETMVAERVAHGASNREIAEALEISERTVKAHLTTSFEKLGVRDRVQLALRMNNIDIYSALH